MPSWYQIQLKNDYLEITLYDEIGMWGIPAKQFIKELKAAGKVKNIHLRINSPGGYVFDGNAIYNALVENGAHITATIDGFAASMASIIAMAADKIIMPENTFLAIHNPMVLIMGDADALKNEAKLLDDIKVNAIKAYRRHAKNLSDKDISDMMDDETWLNADEALDNGFIEEKTEAREIEEDSEFNFAKLSVPERVYAMLLGTEKPGEYSRFKVSGKAIMGKKDNEDEWNEAGRTLDMLNVPEGRKIVNSVIDNNISKKGGKAMHFDEHGNLVDEAGNIVMKASEVKDKIGAIDNASAKEQAEAKLAEGIAAEKNRQSEIRAMAKDVELPEGMLDDLLGDGSEKKPGKSVEEARVTVMEEMKKTMTSAQDTSVQTDESDKTREGLTNALLISSGIERNRDTIAKERKSEFNGFRLQEAVRYCLGKSGVNTATMGAASLGRAFTDYINGPQMAMGMNSSDLLSVLSNTNNVSLLKGYSSLNPTYQMVSSTGTLPDLRQSEMYKNSEAPDVMEIPEGEPPKLGHVSDKYEYGTLVNYGRAYSVTEKMIINDRLDIITTLPEKYGRAIVREINYQYWNTMLVTNPNLNETARALFNVVDGNLAAAAAGITLASLSAAITAFMNYTLFSPDDGRSKNSTQRVNIAPKYLACGPTHIVTAKRYLSSVWLPAVTSEENNVFGPGSDWNLVPIQEPLIDALTSSSPWVCIADPGDMDYAKVYTLAGRETPRSMSKVGGAGEVKGVIFDIEHYWLVKFLDWRGFYQTP